MSALDPDKLDPASRLAPDDLKRARRTHEILRAYVAYLDLPF